MMHSVKYTWEVIHTFQDYRVDDVDFDEDNRIECHNYNVDLDVDSLIECLN